MSSLLAATFTVSAIWPTSSTAFTVAGEPGRTRTSFITAVLNPLSDTVIAYTPGGTPGTVNRPSPFDTASNDTPDGFFTTTVAPGIAPPALSTTLPVMDEVAPCARGKAVASSTNAATRHT